MKNARITWFLATVALCVMVLPATAAETDVTADAPQITDTEGGPTFVQGADGMITVNFPAQSATEIPQYTAATVVADTSGSGSAFAGNYIEAGIKGLSFKIRSELSVASPVYAQVVLQGKSSGRIWRNLNVVISNQQGLWVQNGVGMNRADGWLREGQGDLDAMWTEDLGNVGVIGIRLVQPGSEAQSYSIAEFKLEGDGFVIPGTLTPLEKALLDAFGVTSVDLLSAEQKARDLDGDGMADVVEILSENDRTYANSIFVAEIVPDDGPGILVKWPCIKGSLYTVFRSTSLMNPFASIPDASSLQAVETGFMTYRDVTATGDGPYFYKIRRDDN